jgi:hypothetical protein
VPRARRDGGARLKLGLPAARAGPAQSSSAEASGWSAVWLMASGRESEKNEINGFSGFGSRQLKINHWRLSPEPP